MIQQRGLSDGIDFDGDGLVADELLVTTEGLFLPLLRKGEISLEPISVHDFGPAGAGCQGI